MKEKTKTYLIVAVLVIVIFGGIAWAKGAFFGSPNEAVVDTGADLRVATLELPGLFCSACAWSSENTLKGIPGVVDANVDIGVKKGTVLYDPNVVSKEQLVEPDLIQSYEGSVVDDQKYIP